MLAPFVAVHSLIDIAEILRFTDRANRKAKFVDEMANFHIPESVYVPLIQATGHAGQVVRIPAEEGHVFNTKARAPTLVIFEVLKNKKVHPLWGEISRENEASLMPRRISRSSSKRKCK